MSAVSIVCTQSIHSIVEASNYYRFYRLIVFRSHQYVVVDSGTTWGRRKPARVMLLCSDKLDDLIQLGQGCQDEQGLPDDVIGFCSVMENSASSDASCWCSEITHVESTLC